MINYSEKGGKLHNKLEEFGYTVAHVDGAPILERIDGHPITQDDENAVRNIIDSFDPLLEEQAEAIQEIAEHAESLVSKNINPIKQRRIQADALDATIQKGKGAINALEQAKLDRYETAMTYPNAIFAQYDIEEAAILAETDWQNIRALVETAKANLDGVIWR